MVQILGSKVKENCFDYFKQEIDALSSLVPLYLLFNRNDHHSN
jgi:hypothetical protein